MEFDDEASQRLHQDLLALWKLHLEVHDVKWPKDREKILELMCLYSSLGSPISQDKMAEWISKNGGNYKRQARHHARDGWYIVSGNKKSHYYDPNLSRDELMLVSVIEPNPIKPIKKRTQSEHHAVYTKTLRILQRNRSLPVEKRCHDWIEILKSTSLDMGSSDWDTYHVSTLLALCHPDEYEDQRGEYIGDEFATPHSISAFKSKRKYGIKCQLNDLISGCVCPWTNETFVEKDHYWPHSLGGPTSTENLLYLCKKCNNQKSNSPFYFDFDHIPGWLRNRIKTLYKLKQRTWS